MSGTLYGIGVGPGDPELLTLKAYRLLKSTRIIAYPAPDDGVSFARSIVDEILTEDHTEIPIIVPMRVERFPAAKVYDEAAGKIADHLDQGEDVVVLCEGDPFFYGSFMYLYERLGERFACEVVPGVSSLMASAAALRRPLAARNDVLTVLPAPLDDARLRRGIEEADAVAIIKISRHFERVRALIETMGLIANAGYLERVSLDNQKVMPLREVAEAPAPYFSMILIYKGAENWIGELDIPTACEGTNA